MQWKGKTWSCAVLLKLSRHVLVSALGPNLAWTIFPYNSCDQDLKPTETLISPLKLLQVNVKPLLLHRVLRFLGDLGFLVESQQNKAFSLLKKKIYKTGTPVKNPNIQSTGRWCDWSMHACFLVVLAWSLQPCMLRFLPWLQTLLFWTLFWHPPWSHNALLRVDICISRLFIKFAKLMVICGICTDNGKEST